MKSKDFVRRLSKFAYASDESENLKQEDFERVVQLVFRYLASMPIDECIDTINQMIKSGVKINNLEGKLKEKLQKKGSKGGVFGWTKPFVKGFDFVWQETARIFSPSTVKF